MKPLPAKHDCPECGIAHYDEEGLAKLNAHHSTCCECGERFGEQYMVLPGVWVEAGMDYHDGVLHLACLEKRIGRSLLPSDFDLDIPANALLRVFG